MNINTNRTWADVLACLSTTHTLPSSNICNMLKANRVWINKYIIPYIDNIYISGYTPPESNIKRKNWLMIASIQLGENVLHDSTWVDEASFYRFMEKSIISITRQTRRIPLELLVSDVIKFSETYNSYSSPILGLKTTVKNGDIGALNELQKLTAEQKNCFKKFLSKKGKQLLKKGQVNMLRRGEVIPVSTTLPAIETVIANWQAPHDIKDYSDTYESIYRKFFKNGYVRVELEFESLDKKTANKVYYLPDLNPLVPRYVEEYITVSEQAYLEFIKE